MAVVVKLRHLRIAPRKARLVANLVRGMSVKEAEHQLNFTIKKAGRPFSKLLKSGIATAENDFGFRKDNLKIREIKVDEGPTLKRVRPRARGAFYPIAKRTSHLVLTLDQIEKVAPRRPLKEKDKKDVKTEPALKRKFDRKEKKKLKRALQTPSIKSRERGGRGIFRRKAF